MKSKLKIIIPAVIAIIAVITAIICIKFTPNETVDFDSLMSTAQKYLIEQNYKQAIAEFEKIIDLDPKNVDAYIGIAEAYEGIGDTDKAVEWLEKGYEVTGDEGILGVLERLKHTEENGEAAENTPIASSATDEFAMDAADSPEKSVTNLTGLPEEASSGNSEDTHEMTTPAAETTTVSGTTTPAVETMTASAAETATTTASETTNTTAETTTTPVETTTTTAETTTTTAAAAQDGYVTINGEKYSVELTELDLYMQQLSDEDVEALSKMVNLTSLNLSWTNISDISALSGLTNLTELNLGITKISDISALSGLTNLTSLYLGNGTLTDAKISDFSVLKKLKNLTYLSVGYSDISVSTISGLTNLTTLNLGYSNVSDISEISKLKNLTYLCLNDTSTSDISALSGLTNLTELHLENNGTELGLDNNITDVSALCGLTNLTYLNLSGNNVSESDIEALEKALPDCVIWD